MTEPNPELPLMGWREWIELPEVVAEPIKAKIDTGARSSALHAESIEVFEREGERWVSFEVLPRQKSGDARAQITLPVHDIRMVRSSSGQAVERVVIRTTMRVGGEEWEFDLTLSDREQMGFRMLVGREAIRKRFVVDPGNSFLWGQPESYIQGEDEDDELQ